MYWCCFLIQYKIRPSIHEVVTVFLLNIYFSALLVHISVLICVSFIKKSICLWSITFYFVYHAYLVAWLPLKYMVISFTEMVTQSIKMRWNINSVHIRRDCTFQFGNCISGGYLIRYFFERKQCLEVLVMAFCIWDTLIVDEIIVIYPVHVLWIQFILYMWWCIDSMLYVNTHMMIGLLCIGGFEFLLTHTIWYWS